MYLLCYTTRGSHWSNQYIVPLSLKTHYQQAFLQDGVYYTYIAILSSSCRSSLWGGGGGHQQLLVIHWTRNIIINRLLKKETLIKLTFIRNKALPKNHCQINEYSYQPMNDIDPNQLTTFPVLGTPVQIPKSLWHCKDRLRLTCGYELVLVTRVSSIGICSTTDINSHELSAFRFQCNKYNFHLH